MTKITIYILLFFFAINFNINSQTWNQLEEEYNLILEHGQIDMQLNKAKEIYSWVKNNENDTSIHFPISLKLIGNAFLSISKDSSIKYYDFAIENLKVQNKLNNIQLAIILINKANIYYEIKKYNLAIQEAEKSVEILKKLGYPEYNICLVGLRMSVDFNFNIGNIEKALFYQKEICDVYKINLGDNDTLYAESLFELGVFYCQIKNFKSGEYYLLKSLSIKKKKLSVLNPNYIKNIEILADLYMDIGNYKKAEYYFIKLLDLNNKKLNNDYQNYAKILHSLGILYDELSEYKKAEFFFMESFSIRKKILPEDNWDILESLISLALIHQQLNNYEKAESFALQSLEINKKYFGEEGENYALILYNLGLLYNELGYYKKAESYALESFSIRSKILPGDNRDILESLNSLAVIYKKLDNYKKAESYALQSLEISKKIFGEESKDYALSLYTLGGLYIDLDDYKKAETYILQSIEIIKKTFGKDHSYFSTSIEAIGICYSRSGNRKQANVYLKKSLKLIKRKFGKVSSNYAHNLHAIGANYGLLKKYRYAGRYISKSLYIKEKIFGKNHPEFAKSLHALGVINYLNDNNQIATTYFINYLKLCKKLFMQKFLFLPQNQKDIFWEKEKIFYSFLDYFTVKVYKNNPTATQLSFNSILFHKSFLLENSRTLENVFSKSKNLDVKENFEKLKYNRIKSSKLISENSIDINLIKQLDIEADSIDQILANTIPEIEIFKENFNTNWQNVQSNLSTDAAAIEFSRYYDDSDSIYRYMALIVKQGDKYPQLVNICKENELKQYSPEAELKEIYDLVWKPLLPYLNGIKTIYYSPTGILNNIPFQALYKEENGQREYVLDKFTLHQLTSTRYLALDLKKKELAQIDNSIALFGGINYNDFPKAIIDTLDTDVSSEAALLFKNTVLLNRDLDSTRTGATYLPGTKTEVNNIGQLLKNNNWKVEIIEGKNASENKIKSLGGNNSSILHIATHGFAYPDKEEKRQDRVLGIMQGNEHYKVSDNPMIRSGLLFGGANLTWNGKGDILLKNTNEDGVLTAYELSQLDLSNTKLAVLSACETGKGAIQGSEGTFGLKRALKLAGVDNMIVSLWKVSDEATSEMMTIFYTELAHTKLPVQSFEKAQKQMRDTYPDEPKKWAGFVFVR
jgi:CHAT domain-containing protein/Tfp pilus assembly protein PilF